MDVLSILLFSVLMTCVEGRQNIELKKWDEFCRGIKVY